MQFVRIPKIVNFYRCNQLLQTTRT